MTLEEATALAPAERALLARVADHLIPAAHGMPSAADVLTDDRLRFVFNARPDLLDKVRTALAAGLADDPAARVAALEATDPAALGALQLTIVAGYYLDRDVRERIGYPGQVALSIRSWEVPPYVEEGLIDRLLARGPVWRDPATGKRAVIPDAPRTYAERFAAAAARPPEGDTDGHDGA